MQELAVALFLLTLEWLLKIFISMVDILSNIFIVKRI